METKIDMHVHTAYSDGSTTIRKLIKTSKKKNLYLAVTDHNQIQACLDIRKIDKNFKFIPGIEVKTRERFDILVYFNNIDDLKNFYEKYVKPNKGWHFIVPIKLSYYQVISAARKYDSLIGLAHPYSGEYDKVKHLTEDVARIVDFIEIRNAKQSKISNQKALILAKKLKKPFTGGSDGHMSYDYGGAYILYKSNFTIPKIFKAIKSKNIKIEYKKIPEFRGLMSKRWAAITYLFRPFYPLKYNFNRLSK